MTWSTFDSFGESGIPTLGVPIEAYHLNTKDTPHLHAPTHRWERDAYLMSPNTSNHSMDTHTQCITLVGVHEPHSL